MSKGVPLISVVQVMVNVPVQADFGTRNEKKMERIALGQ